MGKLLIGCLGVASCLSLEAAVLFSEDFSYPNGALTNVSDGKWVLHNGNGAGLFVKSGAVELDSSSTMLTDDVHAPLAGAPIKPDSGTVIFASFDVKLIILPKGAGGYFAHFKDPAAIYRGRVYATPASTPAGCYRLGVANGSAAFVSLATNLSLNTTYKVVVRYDVAGAASALWVNPAAETDPGVQATDSATAAETTSFALRQSLSGGAGAGKVILDNLVVATSFAEALGATSGAPFIVTQPKSQTVKAGDDATFTLEAVGAAPLSYQWRHNGASIPDATTPTLTLTNTSAADAGEYQVNVGNSLGRAISAIATLTVQETAGPVMRFTNVLENLVRPGDAPTNSFTEHALRPGEKLTMTVTVSDPEGRVVTVRPGLAGLPPSAQWNLAATSGKEVTGAFTMQATAAEAGNQYQVSLQAWNDAVTNTANWSVHVPTVAEQQVVITEFLANPTADPGAAHYNPLCRDPPLTQNIAAADEFIELANLSDTDLDLEGWMVADAVRVRHEFHVPVMLLSSNAVLVYGGPLDGFPPRLDVPAEPASESDAGLALNNSGSETIIVRNAASNLVARLVYSGADLSDSGSLSRWPDADGPFVAQSSVSALAVSPGRQWDGRLFSEPAVAPARIRNFAAALGAGGAVALKWDADVGRTYTVWSASQINGPFTALAIGQTNGGYADSTIAGAKTRFYRLSTP
jgi:hypothetical protein